MKIVIDDKIPFIRGLLEPVAEVLYKKGSDIRHKDVIDADALIVRTRTICDKNLLEGTKIRLIVSATIGSDHIDSAWCKANGIKWTNAPGSNSGSVMQYIASALMFLKIKYKLELSQLTLGVIGIGNIGSKVVRLAELLGIKVLQNDPPRENIEGKGSFMELKQLLAKSDIVTVHVPLTFTGKYPTYHLASDDFFSLMKKRGFFINTSRGQVCDENSLTRYLKNSFLTSCILDVWETEPNPDPVLLKYACLATPHIAGYSLDGKLNATTIVVREICKFLKIDVRFPSANILPVPENSEIDLSEYNENKLQTICDIVLKTYPISVDSELLKNRPDKFEELRENYWPRREFKAYKISGEHTIKSLLLQIGFNE
jgi:erythronate-4-phosphate dehydrogenase